MYKPILFALVFVATCALASAQLRYVSTSGSDANNGLSPATAWRTLTFAATTAPSGATIQVATGTYGTGSNPEGIEVSGGKKLAFLGAGPGKTIVEANLGFSPTFSWRGSSLKWYGVFAIHGTGTTVDLSGMTLDAKHLAVERLMCVIYSDGAGGTVENCELRNAGAAVPNGDQSHIAFLAAGKVGSPSTVSLLRSRLHSWNKNGVVMKGDGLTGIIENCEVIGAGPLGGGAAAQNGIQLGDGGDKFFVANTTIRDVFYTPTTYNALGIVVFQTKGPNRIERNTILSCKTGYYHYSTISGATTLAKNHIANCQWALNIFSSGCTAAGNTLDADVSVYVAPSTPATLSGNSYSDYRTNPGYASNRYEADGNPAARDTSVVTTYPGFKAPVDMTQPSGSTPSDIVTGDFNGDGNIDFAVANPGKDQVSVHYGSGGTTFNAIPPATIPVSGGPSFLATGEFSGSTGLDLAVVSLDGTVRILKNNGAGVFILNAPFDLDGTANNSNPTSLDSGEFDAADQEDLIVGLAGNHTTVNGSATVLIVRNSAIVSAAPLLGATVRKAQGVAVGDVSGNGREDIVVVDASNALGLSDLVRVYVQALPGSFLAPVSYPIGADGSGIAVGDLDADGKRDMAVTRSGAPGFVHVFRNGGAGVFSEASASPFRVASGATRVAITDLQDDGDFDTERRDVVVVHPTTAKVTQLMHYVDGRFEDFRGCAVGLLASAIAFAKLDNGPLIDMLVVDKGEDKIELLLADPDGLAQEYGGGCPGTGGIIPKYFTSGIGGTTQGIDRNSRLIIGGLPWGIGLREARAGAPVICLFSLDATPSATCNLQVGGIFFAVLTSTNSNGIVSIGLISPPADPTLVGLNFHSQWGVEDPGGSFLGGYATTRGVRFRISDR